jgi:hypothetical protein
MPAVLDRTCQIHPHWKDLDSVCSVCLKAGSEKS